MSESEPFFDRFSMALAAGRSRRQVLRVVATGIAAALSLPGARGILDALAAETCTVEYPPADLANCPNKRHHPGNTPVRNGCGPAGTDWPSLQSWGTANFRPWCDDHDTCYETCGASKGTCDGTLGAVLRRTCREAYGTDSPIRRNLCITVAGAYMDAVLIKGQKAFDDAQKKDCECCRPAAKIYCFCNKKCYDTATACTSECRASLACNTGICRPAGPGECGQ